MTFPARQNRKSRKSSQCEEFRKQSHSLVNDMYSEELSVLKFSTDFKTHQRKTWVNEQVKQWIK